MEIVVSQIRVHAMQAFMERHVTEVRGRLSVVYSTKGMSSLETKSSEIHYS